MLCVEQVSQCQRLEKFWQPYIPSWNMRYPKDWVATNAAHGVKVIGPRDEGSEKIKPPSKDEIRQVIDAAREDLRLMLIFAASTGARAGEQWGIGWRDVNFERGELDISRRVDVYGDEGAPRV